jgi:two-component system sensor histidine kinase DesK
MPRPFRKELGWTPYVYLVYLFFAFAEPVLGHAKALEWIITLVGFALFLPCYVGVFQRWRPGAVCYMVAMAIIGLSSLPFNSGAACYVIYAGASLGFLLTPTNAMRGLGLLMGVFALELWLMKAPVWFAVFMLLIVGAVSLSNIYHGSENRANARLKLAHDELQHLARVAERERIARDLHDVLGHTLSVIVLKSELAGKLIERDPARAQTEIMQVEQVARDALSEVRQAIGGYRAASLAEEFARAKETLETAGVSGQCDVSASGPKLGAAQEALLSLVVREAITNVVRHASAAHCHLLLADASNGWRLCIVDDGRGGVFQEGNGLRGMRERVEAVGGHMICESRRGTKLDIFIPRKVPQEATA